MIAEAEVSVLTDEIRAMRVAIAQDVLAQLAAEKFQCPRNTGYLSGELPVAILDAGGDLQSAMDELKHCRVCLLGACVLAKARLYNDCSLTLFERGIVEHGIGGRSDDAYELLWLEGSDVLRQLEPIFDRRTLSLMESAFEMVMVSRGAATAWECIDAVAWGRRFSGPEVVRRVMQNIIDNNGEFIVPKYSAE